MRELARAQAASGKYASVSVGVVTYRDWPATYQSELAACGLPVFRSFTPKMFGTASFLFQRLQRPPIEKWVQEISRQSKARQVVVHFHNAWMSGVFLPLRKCTVKSAAVATFHGVNAFLDRQPLRHRAHQWMARRLLSYNATLTSVDAANLERAESIFGIPKNRLTIVPNGVTATTARACPFLDGKPKLTIGHVGSLIPQKGWKIAAEAVITGAKAGVPCRMIIAGAGPQEPEARAMAAAYPQIIEFRGFVPDPRQNLMPELDILAVMSSHEGLPMSAVEALSVGLPIAGTNVGGMAEVIKHGETGFLIERSSTPLHQVIANVAANQNNLEQLSKASLNYFKERFEISKIIEGYDSVYASALAQ